MNPGGSILTIAAAIFLSWFVFRFLSWFVFRFLSWFVFRKSLDKNNTNPENKGIPPPTSINNTTSSASASSSAADLAGEYEVFLSFRGTDTRQGFTDFLYTYLVGAGICTFRDDNELRIGEEIGPDLLKAIKDSKISVPIFSKNYASSKWCLLELAQMVECHINEGQMIFPIFYDMEPSDVRNQKGSYEKAFRQHEKNFDEKKVQGWKDAMTVVGKLKGLELKKEANGHEGQLVKMVVEKVVLGLKKNYTHVSDNLVGMNHHVKEMERLLDVNYDGVRIVGIHGMGGIGKTTISKAIYNQLCDHFECCCFLDDVRERSQHHNGVVVLQNELVSKILKQQFPRINNADEGINKIKDVVRRKKVLLVLDDIDGISQFNKLVGKCRWFGAGSRIVVTTRNKEVLDTLEVTCQREGLLEVYKSYEPLLMKNDHSLQLFSKYAFKRDSPPKDYNILSKDVVFTAAGLPLVLVTIGSVLFGKEDKALWEEILRKLRRISHKEVLDKLRISFEALDYEEQQIFLDIACLFIGENKINPYYMWDDCEFYPRNGINTLVLRSLVKVGDDNTLRMHDQLRDLGRQIVWEENLKKSGERSRVWQPEEALEVLKGGLGTKNVEALNLDLRAVTKVEYKELQRIGEVYEQGEPVERFLEYEEPKYIRHLGRRDFSQLPNLRFLRLGYVFLDGDFKHLFPNLRWLEWRYCGKFIPINLNLENLVILDLSDSTITDEWEGWTLFKESKKLKVLNLSGCTGLRRGPNFSTITTVEILILSHTYLVQINPLFRNLITLRALDLSYCTLSKLDCSIFKDLDLESLNLDSCKSLLEVSGLEWSESLTSLNASNCPNLRTLGDLSKLKKLKELKICYSFLFSEIQVLEKLDFLELCMRTCTSIEGLGGLESLELLDMRGCRSITRLPDLSNLRMLKKLLLKDCSKLHHIEGLGCFESLEIVDMMGCRSIERLPDLSDSRMLKELLLKDCENLREVGDLGGLVSLEHLDMWGCESMERLPELSNLGKLKKLSLYNCTKLREIEGLSGLVSLESLELSSCKSLGETLDLSNVKNLKELRAADLKHLTEIRGLEELKSLEVLEISGCSSLEKLSDLSNLKSLKILDALGCEKLPEIHGLEELKKRHCLMLFDWFT